MVQHGPDCKLGYRGPPAGLQASPCEACWSGLLKHGGTSSVQPSLLAQKLSVPISL